MGRFCTSPSLGAGEEEEEAGSAILMIKPFSICDILSSEKTLLIWGCKSPTFVCNYIHLFLVELYKFLITKEKNKSFHCKIKDIEKYLIFHNIAIYFPTPGIREATACRVRMYQIHIAH